MYCKGSGRKQDLKTTIKTAVTYNTVRTELLPPSPYKEAYEIQSFKTFTLETRDEHEHKNVFEDGTQ